MSDFDRNSVRWGQTTAPSQASVDQGLRSYMIGIYNNMTLGLATTGIIAYLTTLLTVRHTAEGIALTDLGQTLYVSPLKYVVIFAPFAFVMFVQFQFRNWSTPAVRAAFFAYAAMLGISLSVLFVVYTGVSIANAFFITATAFAACSVFGYTTKRDLSPVASFCIMGLWGAIIASIVGLFLQSSVLQIAISVIIVLVSAGLQAWDTQRAKEFYYESGSYESASRLATISSLSMYINFINMFISILRLTGSRN